MLAFLSYQTVDRHVAAEVRAFLADFGIPTFMAHDDLEVSDQWQDVILDRISAADIFVAILSAAYLASPYCLQESGIAVFRKAANTIIPLSIDETISPGFLRPIQSRRVDPGKINPAILFAGIVRYNATFALDVMINRLGVANTFAQAETAFALLQPHLALATQQQVMDILGVAAANNQVRYAWGIKPTLSDLLADYGDLISEQERGLIEAALGDD
jgi:hypothetical protein